jgi:hypothetical protein
VITGAFFETNAPKAYDGFGTTTMSEIDEDKRLVWIYTEHQTWQLQRYISGMYGAVAVDAKIRVAK